MVLRCACECVEHSSDVGMQGITVAEVRVHGPDDSRRASFAFRQKLIIQWYNNIICFLVSFGDLSLNNCPGYIILFLRFYM